MKIRPGIVLLAVALVAVVGGWTSSLRVGPATAHNTKAVLVAPDGWSWGDGLPAGWSSGDGASAVPVQLDSDVPTDASLDAPTGWGGAAPDGWSWGGGEE